MPPQSEYSVFPIIFTPASGLLTIDNVPFVQMTADTAVEIKKAEDSAFIESVNLIYGGAVYNYIVGSRNLTLEISALQDSTFRLALETKITAFHTACIKGTNIVPANLFKVSVKGGDFTLAFCFMIPTMEPGATFGAKRSERKYSFIIHKGLDYLRKSGAPAITVTT